ncbi:hypothetical protein GW7_18832 [Heterocephalus glaber]|uniref:Uncharacterized protein n=1 Tax=Heterocephalus glaber TaxID=10181 RepID=G5AZH9_HETGA|nr:hypothetical protein GW7_18832 [Heterocephalus glaber]
MLQSPPAVVRWQQDGMHTIKLANTLTFQTYVLSLCGLGKMLNLNFFDEDPHGAVARTQDPGQAGAARCLERLSMSVARLLTAILETRRAFGFHFLWSTKRR